MSVLLVSNKYDVHSDALVKAISNQKGEVFRLNTEDLGSTVQVSYTPDKRGEFSSRYRSVAFQNIQTIAYRRPQKVKLAGVGVSPNVQEFVAREAWTFLMSLWQSLDCFWVSKPANIRVAESKLDQLHVAPALGFRVPKTLISNRYPDALRFIEECGGEVINKVLASVVLSENDVDYTIYARKVKASDLERGSVELVPCVFQEAIPKAFELRITVVGDEVFAAEIHSQNSERTKDDWRRYDLENTPHKVHCLPVEVANACRALVNHYGLNFGTIDMIVTPEGEYVFLEINPNGQWLWIEKLTSLPITESLAKMLVKGSR